MIPEIRKLAAQGEYQRAIEHIDAIMASGLVWPDLLVTKAMYMTLSDGDSPLEEIEETFKAALEIDPDHVEALVEYAYFQLNLMDRAREALSLFRRAAKARARSNAEIALGILHCLQETDPAAPADRELEKIDAVLVDRGGILEDCADESNLRPG